MRGFASISGGKLAKDPRQLWSVVGRVTISAALVVGGYLTCLSVTSKKRQDQPTQEQQPASSSFVLPTTITLPPQSDLPAPSPQVPAPADYSGEAHRQWKLIAEIEKHHDALREPDPSLLKAEKYDEFVTYCYRSANDIEDWRNELASAAGKDEEESLTKYKVRLMTYYSNEAEYLRHIGMAASEVKAYRSRIVGLSAFVGGLLHPRQALDDIFVRGPRAVKEKAEPLKLEGDMLEQAKEKLTSLKIATCSELHHRYGGDFQ
jgi:hypothetical protein